MAYDLVLLYSIGVFYVKNVPIFIIIYVQENIYNIPTYLIWYRYTIPTWLSQSKCFFFSILIIIPTIIL